MAAEHERYSVFKPETETQEATHGPEQTCTLTPKD